MGSATRPSDIPWDCLGVATWPVRSRALQLHSRVWLQQLVTRDRPEEHSTWAQGSCFVRLLVRPSTNGCPPRGWASILQNRSVTRTDRSRTRWWSPATPPLGFGSFQRNQLRWSEYSVASAVPSALRVSHRLSGFLPPEPRGFVSRHIRP